MMKKGVSFKLFVHFYLVFFSLFVLGPLILLVLNGLKPKLKIMTSPFSLPQSLTLSSLIDAWVRADYLKGYLNSFTVELFTVLIVIVVASLAAYVLAKMKFKGKNVIMASLLINPAEEIRFQSVSKFPTKYRYLVATVLTSSLCNNALAKKNSFQVQSPTMVATVEITGLEIAIMIFQYTCQ